MIILSKYKENLILFAGDQIWLNRIIGQLDKLQNLDRGIIIMEITVKELLEECEKKNIQYNKEQPFEIAKAFLAKKYPYDKADLECPLRFLTAGEDCGGERMKKDGFIFFQGKEGIPFPVSEKVLQGEIAEYLHEMGVKVILWKINLVLLFLQQASRSSSNE